MRLDRFQSFLESACIESHVASFESEHEENFSAVVYCKLSGDNYDDSCLTFLKKFSTETQTNWITYMRHGHHVRYLFRKTYSCHLSKKNKTNKVRKFQNNIRDWECEAKIDFKWKILNRDTCKNDKNLKTGLNCMITINFDHNHPITSAGTMWSLRCTKETNDRFRSYFQSGLPPVAAKSLHEVMLAGAAEDDHAAAIDLANAQINPTVRQVMYFYDHWKRDHHQPLVNTLKVLLNKKEQLENNGYYLSIKDDTLDVAIVTPIMKRVFEELSSRENVVFIESSDSYSTSKVACAMNNLFLTFVFISSKIGALPIACVLQTSHNFQVSLSLLKDTLERAAGRSFNPKIIMTYGSTIQIIALKTIFPSSKVLLSTSPIRQNTWKLLGVSKNNVNEKDKIEMMKCFQKVLKAPTIDSAHAAYKELQSRVKDHPQASKHFESWWFRRSEWALPFLTEVLPEGIDLEDCEVSVRVLKDTILHKSKGFNTPAFVDLVCDPIENYHRQRLEDFANGRDDRVTSHYSKFCQTDYDSHIVEVGVDEYLVHSRTCDKNAFRVNTDLAVCDCKGGGRDGRYCVHLAAIEKKFNFWVAKRPVLTDEDRAIFSRIVSGSASEVKITLQPTFENVQVKSELEEYTSDTEKSEVAEVASFSSRGIDVDPLCIVKEENCSTNQEIVRNTRKEFDRIADLLELLGPESTTTMVQFHQLVCDVTTPEQARQFMVNIVQSINRTGEDTTFKE